MPTYFFIWDEGEGGNVEHLAEHDVTPEEAEYVVENAPPKGRTVSRSSGERVAFGCTPARRFMIVVYEQIDDITIYINTAYDVPEPKAD